MWGVWAVWRLCVDMVVILKLHGSFGAISRWILRCVLASLYEGTSVGPSVGPSVCSPVGTSVGPSVGPSFVPSVGLSVRSFFLTKMMKINEK